MLNNPEREKPDELPSFYVCGGSCACPPQTIVHFLQNSRQLSLIQTKQSRKNYASRDQTRPLFLQKGHEGTHPALLCFSGRRWAWLQRAPQNKLYRLAIAIQLGRPLTQKGCLANILRKPQKLHSLLKADGGVGGGWGLWLKWSHLLFSFLI